MKTFRHLVHTQRITDEGKAVPVSEIAENSGYSRAYFYRLMGGVFRELPSRGNLANIAAALGVSPAKVRKALVVSRNATQGAT